MSIRHHSKYVPTSSITVAEKNPNHVPKCYHTNVGRNFKRRYVTSPNDIYRQSKPLITNCVEFPEGFLLGFNKSHWSNEEETLRHLKKVISPYITKAEKKLKLPQN